MDGRRTLLLSSLISFALVTSAAQAQTSGSGRYPLFETQANSNQAPSFDTANYLEFQSQENADSPSPSPPVPADQSSNCVCQCEQCQQNSKACECQEGCKLLGTLATRERLFGNLFGAESFLAEKGIVTDFKLGHYYQGVTTGGNEQTSEYGGKLDMYFTFLGEKFGVNKGFNVIMHAEQRWGRDITSAAGGLTLPNAPLLYPLPGDYQGVNITGLFATQSLLDGKATALFGKLNSFDLVTGFFPTIDGGRGGFMNVHGMVSALPWFRFVNLSEWGGGVWMNTEDGQIGNGILVFGLNNVSTSWDFSPSFEDGLGILGWFRHFWEVGDKPGYFMLVVGGATKEYPSLDISDWLDVPGNGPTGTASRNPWDIAPYIVQTLWQDPSNKDRRINFLAGGTIADDNPSFGNWNALGHVEAFGLNPSRPGDRMGISGWYNGISQDAKNLAFLAAGQNVRDNWGVELYYNREITPWFHLTPDLQILQNSNADTDTSLVLGLRAIIDL